MITLDTELLKRSFLGWLRGKVITARWSKSQQRRDEDAKRPNRERDNLIGGQMRVVDP